MVMDKLFFTKSDFSVGFGRELSAAYDVYEQRMKSGIKEYALATYDFVFISDKNEKLERLGTFLSNNYDYKITGLAEVNDYWELTGNAIEFPVDEENLRYWVIGLYDKGFEFDCRLDGYGAIGDPEKPIFPKMDEGMSEHYFELAMEAYNKKNTGMAFIYFSTAIKINANNPNAWYSRAIIRDELHTWKAARRDYDKAIELAPDFTDAILNRAANKDDAGDFESAILDYTKVIEIEPKNAMAYFNRGNSKLNLKDKKGACDDWHNASKLGADYAAERISQHCACQSSQ
jgi:tetratricopeptide (TPR) repeat protein